ncbi:MAG: glycosyltransferase [Thermoflexales bacterium]|nr:glycosyltransferase [Thermoflexales bacterium]
MVEHGYQVDLVAQQDAENDFLDGIHFYQVGEYEPSFTIRPLERLWRVRRAFEIALRSEADIFQFYSPEFISYALALRKQTGKPVIFDCMEDFEGYVQQRPGIPGWLRPLVLRYTRRQLQRAALGLDAIVTADQGTADYFRPWARRMLALYNLPVLSAFPDVPEENAPLYDLVFHGGLGRHYFEAILKIDEALQARGRHVTWYLFGIMPERAWILAEVEKRHAEERFRIGELVPHDQVMAEVRKARIGIIPLPNLPKYYNNIPQKLFEYMALRMPVVLSDLPPSRPFVGDGACALMVGADDPGAFAEAIVHLLDDPNLCRRMGAEGRARIEREYHWEKESLKLIELYEELLN